MSKRLETIPLGGALASLIRGFDTDFALPETDVPHAARRRVQDALGSPALYLDVADRLCSQIVHDPQARFLFADPRSRYVLQVFCWPVGFGNQPHLHGNWNVSAVLAGSLLVFRSPLSAADCVASEPLIATAGNAGVVTPPQFHCLRNVGAATAITFHVFSTHTAGDDMADLELRPTLAARFDDDDLLAIAAEAARHQGARAEEIIRTAFAAAAGSAAKLELVKWMARLDPVTALPMARSVSELVGGQDGLRLRAVADRLEAAYEARDPHVRA